MTEEEEKGEGKLVKANLCVLVVLRLGVCDGGGRSGDALPGLAAPHRARLPAVLRCPAPLAPLADLCCVLGNWRLSRPAQRNNKSEKLSLF